MKVTTCILLALGVCAFLFAEPIVTVFRRDDPQVIAIGTLALRLQLSTLPLWGMITMTNMLTQSIGYGVRATLLAVSRQGIFLIPSLLVLPNVIGLLGIQIAQPISDACTFVLALAISYTSMKSLKKQ